MSETDAQDDTKKEGKKISLKVVSQDGNEIFFQVRARAPLHSAGADCKSHLRRAWRRGAVEAKHAAVEADGRIL